jgi:hypothetical protein
MTDSFTPPVSANAAPPTPMADDINAYQPPQGASQMTPQTPAWTPSVPATSPAPINSNSAPVSTGWAPAAPAQTPTPTPTPAPQPAASTPAESLESQNIFALLGVDEGAESDKEAFLDELQEVIWNDFLGNDLQLLLTREELDQVKAIQAKTTDPLQQQTEIVTFLEKLIPDLEDIMLEKALELKRRMVQERVSGLRAYLAGKPDQLAQVDAAEQLIKQNRWTQAAQTLNALR